MNIELYCNDKIIKDATWNDIETVLPELKEEAFFRISIIPWPEKGPISLEVQ